MTTTTASPTVGNVALDDGVLTIVMDASMFRTAVTWAAHTVGKDHSIPILEGVHFTVGPPSAHVPHFTPDFMMEAMGGYCVTVACTDRYRVAWASAPVQLTDEHVWQPLDGATPAEPFTMVVSGAELVNAFKVWPKKYPWPPTVTLRFQYDAKQRPDNLQVSMDLTSARLRAVEGEFPRYASFATGEWLDGPAGAVGFNSQHVAQLATAANRLAPRSALRLRPNGGGKPVGATVTTGSDVRVSALLMPVRLGS